MKHSIATVSMSGTLPEKLQAVAEAGFDGVEIFENDLLYFNGTPSDIRDMCHDLGLAIMLFQPFRDFEGGPRERLNHQLNRAERKFDLMEELGCQNILVCSSVSPALIPNDDIIASDLYLLAERAAKRNLQIGYEALAWGRHVYSYRHAWKIVQKVNHPNLGIILDSFHTLSIQDDLSELSQIDPKKITFIQLADAPKLDMNILEWSRHFRNFPGQGDFDIASFMSPIIANGYDGPLSLEIFNDYFRAAPCEKTAKDARISLHYLEQQIRQSLPQIPESASLMTMPPTPKALDWEFLEFAVDYKSGKALGHLLKQLGFDEIGTHKSKDVSLYRQGDISIILNKEPDSFARSYFNLHGPSLCATALRVDNAKNAYDHAVQLGRQPFRSRIGINERAIPAVISPHDSLHYFVDANTPSSHLDFEFTQPVQSSLLQTVDHFALGMPADSLDSWTLHLRSVLGLTSEGEQAIVDPYGLIKSRVLRNDNGNVRVILNSSKDPNTILSQSISQYKGSGLQHIAFSCSDIFTVVDTLRSNGMQFLAIPDNYYDDLQARFGLTDEYILRLKNNHILYDSDEKGGEFLHIYTLPFADRFFFEIVERRNNYQQYGAANAPVRLAAMSRHMVNMERRY